MGHTGETPQHTLIHDGGEHRNIVVICAPVKLVASLQCANTGPHWHQPHLCLVAVLMTYLTPFHSATRVDLAYLRDLLSDMKNVFL